MTRAGRIARLPRYLIACGPLKKFVPSDVFRRQDLLGFLIVHQRIGFIVWERTQDPGRSKRKYPPPKCSQFCRQPISKSVIIGDVPIAIREWEGEREQQPCRSWAMPKVLHFSALN